MGMAYMLTRASTHKQEDSPDVQARLMTRHCELLGIENPIRLDEPLGTSGRKSAFAERPMGNWIMHNLGEGDTLIVTKMDRLGRSLIDAFGTIDKLSRRGVRLIVLNFAKGEPLDLTGAVQKFVVQILMAAAELEGNLIGERTAEALAYLREKRGLLFKLGPGRKRHKGPDGRWVIEWDHEQLGLIAEMARRSLTEPMHKVAEDYLARGILDHRGKPFLYYPCRKRAHAYKEFNAVRRWFWRSADAGLLPPEWCEVARNMGRNKEYTLEKGPVEPGHPCYEAHQGLKRYNDAKKAAKHGLLDRSAWTAEQWQEWYAALERPSESAPGLLEEVDEPAALVGQAHQLVVESQG